jgi:PhzF family phenazine biosynthesis protein
MWPPFNHRPPAAGQQSQSWRTLFGYRRQDLDSRIPPAVAEAGARHLILVLRDHGRLAPMHYDLAKGRALMLAQGFATISLVQAERTDLFHARNPFAAGGVYEDPATGAAAAALGGYLRDISWPHGGSTEILQGQDMGVPSRLHADISPEPEQASASPAMSGSSPRSGSPRGLYADATPSLMKLTWRSRSLPPKKAASDRGWAPTHEATFMAAHDAVTITSSPRALPCPIA